jgi:replicative DNA helicase
MPLILQDPDAELAVLNGVLADQEALDELDLRPEDFTDVKRIAMFRAMVTVHEAGRTLDIISLSDQLRVDKAPVTASEASHLSPVTAANIAYYASKVRELSTKRQILAIARSAKDGLESNTSEQVMDMIEQRLTDLAVGRTSTLKKPQELLGPAIHTLEQRYQLHGQIPGLSTGFSELDHVLTGLLPGSFYIIGARTSQGKTALALTMALNQAMSGKPVGFFSAEMTDQQLIIRALAGVGRVNTQSIATGLLRESDFSRLVDAGQKLYDVPLYIDDTPSISLTHLRSRARKMRRMGAQCIYVDYLTLIRHGDSKMPKHERVGEVSENLKELSRELNIPVVALSQVRRDAEGRMPNCSDLKESGDIEDDADVIIFLFRGQSDDNPSGGLDRLTLVNIAKNRHGATETIQLIFIPEYVRFESKAGERSKTP